MDLSQILTVLQTNASVAGVVLIYHLFGLQNWIQVAEQLKAEAETAATSLAISNPDRQLISEKCRSHLTEFPRLMTTLIGALVLGLCAASAIAILEVYPAGLSLANALLVASPIITVAIGYLLSTSAFYWQGRGILRVAQNLL